ncbi:P-loop containing nucleoside triphosphate hydrolase protein [Obba rivulosa]|uniref:P-loop containing nucleoside triphosphate hydrolase protein n=1 Tax=Obba rivulosa TaxID=1052685 RepID=A0A8E2DN33_9APHY|nr:P-loop containing nucleoside triphosphate hydrolase protein [Obba rivulosa]
MASSFLDVFTNLQNVQSPLSFAVSSPAATLYEGSTPNVRLEMDIMLFNIILPAGTGALMLIYDLFSSVNYPKPVRRFMRTISSPFMDFLTLEDLDESAGTPAPAAVWKHRSMAMLSICECVAWAAISAYSEVVHERSRGVLAMVECIAWLYVSLRIIIKPPVTPPYLTILFCLTNAAFACLDLFVGFMNSSDRHGFTVVRVLDLCVTLLLAWIAGTLPLEAILPVKNVARETDIPSSSLCMPEDSVNLWTWSTFSFVEPIFSVAMTRTLNEPDIWSLSPYFKHKNLFRKYLRYCSEHPTHSLLRFLLASNSLDLIIDMALELWSAIVGFVPAYALQRILSALSDPSPESRKTAYTFALVTFLAHLSFAQFDLYKRWHTRRCYERTRGQLFCALHYKALKRRDISGQTGQNENGDQRADLGKIVNLMQGDAYAVAQRFWEFAGVFGAPVRLTIAMVFLYRVLGWSSFAAVGVILVAYVINYPLVKYNVHVARQSWKAKDKRMNLVNEFFQNIRFLKFYGWETGWATRVRDSREIELKWRIKENFVNAAISFIWTWIPSATALASFLCYTLVAGERLTVAKAFTSIALFSQLQEPMLALPGQVFALIYAYVSMQRIETFLAEEEVPEWASSVKMSSDARAATNKDIGFEDASFEWDASPADEPVRFTFGPLNVKFPFAKLTLVSGPTGSGKSALLAALLGEMHCISGHVILNKAGHQVAYCAQNPWLENATIRDNIVFGAMYGFDNARYQAVLEACALLKDLEIFPAGDMTEIGEKGITLSGGQRARIALARALYSQATCILLDDPLAAVDMHTAQHLVKNALSGDLARDRTIILVTHHISLCLPLASHLIELSNGRVVRHGSVDDLRRNGQLEKFVEAEDVAEAEDHSSQSSDTHVECDADGPGRTGEQPKADAPSGKLVEAEARAEGRVSIHTYWMYIKAAGLASWIITLLLMLFIRVINIGNQFFLAKWGEAYERAEIWVAHVLQQILIQSPWDNLPSPDVNVRPWLLLYLYISTAGAFAVLSYIALGYYASLQASRSLFRSMLGRLTGAPSRFFDITPVGRILNRFTTDINTVDGALLNSARAALSGTLNFIASFLVIIWVVPTFAPFAVFIAWLYIRLAPLYVQASRDLRRLESISLSPAFAGFDELLRGLVHVRAFGMEERYQDRFYQRVDLFQSYDHVYWLVAGWLRWRYDCLGSVVVFCTTLFALWTGVSSGYAALVIVQAGIFAEASRQLVRVLAQLELDFNSVERIVEYLDVPQEAPAVIHQNRPPAWWPSSHGEIQVENLVVRYAPGLPAVLRNLSFTIKPGEKIGVVGRTGSGKSTLALSFLRVVEPSEGRIVIDSIDISQIGLDDLRSRITIISQDVSLFAGTIRSNLDPFGAHSDEECWDVLERCHLTSILHRNEAVSTSSRITLDTPIGQTGSLSAGERQLLALARAVLRRSNVVIMDEATSQIDSALDDKIQRTIREEFASSIVITIAHRLRTVLDYDRILVLGNGGILELDTPVALMSKLGGIFREMCRASADWATLVAVVEERSGARLA